MGKIIDVSEGWDRKRQKLMELWQAEKGELGTSPSSKRNGGVHYLIEWFRIFDKRNHEFWDSFFLYHNRHQNLDIGFGEKNLIW